MNGVSGTDRSETDAPDADDGVAGHEDLQALVIDASTTLLSANPDELDTKLTWTLRSVATGLGADYAGVYEAVDVVDEAGQRDDHGHEDFVRRYGWHRDAAGGTDSSSGVEAATAPALDRIDGGDAVRIAGDDRAGVEAATGLGDQAPAGDGPAGSERTSDWSVLAVPIVREYELWGALLFVGGTDRRRWADHEVVLVRSLADLIASSFERVERERRLTAQNDRLEEFAEVVSHDLRNPLNVMTASVDLAERTGDPEYFERAARAADRMDGIIETVLGLSRAGRDIGSTETVEIGRVARAAWTAVDTESASLVVDAPGQYSADERRLRDVFSNLFRNAIDHAGSDVTVTVGGLDGDRDGFYVADDGPGLPDGADGLFERGASGASGGTGLGLTIVRRVVDAHGWDIRATDGEAGGARFDIVVDP
ncbi:sensor histidine kinase [Halobaculum gomorrense]|uniref:histidine kinase n=1 Tax=Halobaculum gomorrense TaxID=43928 RepID=A0A1M5P966_9EURY|nr:GAF domain-containing sensor histidine kinase [Halobaculum gomorrense]SHG98237.1 Signal transduction histidine kinase [Halobaculum gomorrense]